MAYVNSGIAMKSAHYDWKIIIVIALFLAAITVLVALKLVYPEFEPGKLLSAACYVSHVSALVSNAIVTGNQSDIYYHIGEDLKQYAMPELRNLTSKGAVDNITALLNGRPRNRFLSVTEYFFIKKELHLLHPLRLFFCYY